MNYGGNKGPTKLTKLLISVPTTKVYLMYIISLDIQLPDRVYENRGSEGRTEENTGPDARRVQLTKTENTR
jgi:hypothetical protein